MKYDYLQSFIKKDYGKPDSFNTFGYVCFMKKIVFLFVILMGASFSSFAQTDTVEIVVNDSLISSMEQDSTMLLTNVNVFKDPRLDVLKKRPNLVMRNKAKEDIIRKRKEKLGVSNVRNYSAIHRGKRKVTGSIVTRKGYRVNIYSGASRSEAINVKRKFMRRYSGTPSYMSYITPYFKIRVGNFASKTSAYRFLRKIQSAGFSKSFVVPDIVTIKDINVR